MKLAEAVTVENSHSGKSMLSGINPKNRTELDAAVSAYLADGGTVTMVKSKKSRAHSPYTKSHRFGGRFSSYNVGGKNRLRAARKSA
jgi:hypothetical protein